MSETSINTADIYNIKEESPARVFVALRNALDCSCDQIGLRNENDITASDMSLPRASIN